MVKERLAVGGGSAGRWTFHLIEQASRGRRDLAGDRGPRIILGGPLNLLRRLRSADELDEHQGFVEAGRDAAAGETIAIETVARIAGGQGHPRKARHAWV